MKCKLIRARLKPKGRDVTTRKPCSRGEHIALLVAKIYEETAEIAESKCQDPEEYCDVLQALMDLAAVNEIDWQTIVHARGDKLTKRGGFLAGVVMEAV